MGSLSSRLAQVERLHGAEDTRRVQIEADAEWVRTRIATLTAIVGPAVSDARARWAEWFGSYIAEWERSA